MVRYLKGALRALVTHCASDHRLGAKPPTIFRNAALRRPTTRSSVPFSKTACRYSRPCGSRSECHGLPWRATSAVVAHADGFARVRECLRSGDDDHGRGRAFPSTTSDPSLFGSASDSRDSCAFMTPRSPQPRGDANPRGGPRSRAGWRGKFHLLGPRTLRKPLDVQDGDEIERLWFSKTLLWALYSTHAGHERLNLRAIDVSRHTRCATSRFPTRRWADWPLVCSACRRRPPASPCCCTWHRPACRVHRT